jgi:hypothetical protein
MSARMTIPSSSRADDAMGRWADEGEALKGCGLLHNDPSLLVDRRDRMESLPLSGNGRVSRKIMHVAWFGPLSVSRVSPQV